MLVLPLFATRFLCPTMISFPSHPLVADLSIWTKKRWKPRWLSTESRCVREMDLQQHSICRCRASFRSVFYSKQSLLIHFGLIQTGQIASFANDPTATGHRQNRTAQTKTVCQPRVDCLLKSKAYTLLLHACPDNTNGRSDCSHN